MHNAAFSAMELDYVYVAHDVSPESLPSAVHGARTLNYCGLSITIPHKVAAMALVDEVDRVAAGIGCINTIVQRDGKLIGYNSDGLGALGALSRAGADPTGREVVVLGSGGAARAIAMTLAMQAPPSQLTILGILPHELDQLAQAIKRQSNTHVQTLPLDDAHLANVLPAANLLLQTTPVGMAPHTDASLVPRELLHSDLVVFDAVYTPRRTQLLRDAAERGARVVEGLEMFLGQALVQFKLFTGHEPPEQTMRQVVEARLSTGKS
jgi:shikimate dehydrogenase